MAENPQNPVDLNAIVGTGPYRFKGTLESPADAEARLVEEAKAADYKRLERSRIVWFALAMVFLFFVFCIYLYVIGSADDRKWSLAILTSIITGILTYTFRPRLD